jgi:hypothetical protein
VCQIPTCGVIKELREGHEERELPRSQIELVEPVREAQLILRVSFLFCVVYQIRLIMKSHLYQRVWFESSTKLVVDCAQNVILNASRTGHIGNSIEH